MTTALPIESLLPSRRTLVRNILRTFDAATPIESRRGMEWYQLAHLFAAKISDGQTEMGAGVIAALSPQKSWLENMFLAQRAFEQGRATGHVGPACVKANRIMDGELPLDVLGGNKVRSFYKLIVDPTDPFSVCIDRHAFDVALNKVTEDQSRRILERVRGYELLADGYRRAAASLSVLPSQVQAVTWVKWRNGKRSGLRTV